MTILRPEGPALCTTSIQLALLWIQNKLNLGYNCSTYICVKNSQYQIESYPPTNNFLLFPYIVALLVSIDVVIMTAWQIVDPFFREIKDLEPIVSIS